MNEQIEILITANDYLYKLKNGIEQVIEAFQREDNNTACSLIPSIAEGIEWIMQVIVLTKDVQKEEIDISNLHEKLEEIVEAIENEDYVLVGDLFNYELLPVLDEVHKNISKIITN